MISNYVYFLGFLSSALVFLSVYTRYKRSGSVICVTDPYYITIIFYFFYYIVGQFGRISLDDFYENVYFIVSIMVLFSTVILFIATIVTDAKVITVSFQNELQKQIESRKFIVAAFICLIIGYIFWYLNYSRLGNISSIFTENRVDRNAKLTSMTGNLPYTHFMFAGYCFYLTACLFKNKTVLKSVIISLILILPLIIFYFLEGERSAILKYIIASFFIISFIRFKGTVFLKANKIYLFILLALIMSVLGNVRSGVQHYLNTGDPTQIEAQFNIKGLKMLIPNEFFAVNFVTNKSVDNILNDGHSLQFGYSYFQSIPYLFPRSVYRIAGMTKNPTIADKFGEDVRVEIYRERKMGFGMSGIAEAFLNFHFIGVIIFPVLLFSIISLWRNFIRKTNSVYVIYLLLTLTPTFVILHRTAFASVFSFFAYVTFISFMAYWCSSVLLKFIPIKNIKK